MAKRPKKALNIVPLVKTEKRKVVRIRVRLSTYDSVEDGTVVTEVQQALAQMFDNKVLSHGVKIEAIETEVSSERRVATDD